MIKMKLDVRILIHLHVARTKDRCRSGAKNSNDGEHGWEDEIC